jgi:hypothetical protein
MFGFCEAHIYPHNQGTYTDNTYDLGSSSYRWKDGYFGGGINVGTATGAGDGEIKASAGGSFMGNVGIGTTSPTEKLSISGPSMSLISAASGDVNFYFGEGTGSDQYGVLRWDSTSNYLSLANQANANAFVIKAGNVGIGTTAPTSTLQVVGTITCNGINCAGTITATDLISSGDIYTTRLTFFSSSIYGFVSTSATDVYYKKVGNTIFIYYSIYGTSFDDTLSFTVPFTASSALLDLPINIQYAGNNSNVLTNGAWAVLRSGRTTVTAYIDATQKVWTQLNEKYIRGSFFYEI